MDDGDWTRGHGGIGIRTFFLAHYTGGVVDDGDWTRDHGANPSLSDMGERNTGSVEVRASGSKPLTLSIT